MVCRQEALINVYTYKNVVPSMYKDFINVTTGL